MYVGLARRICLLTLSLCVALGRAQGQTAIDTLALAKLVGRAFGREIAEAKGVYIVDTTDTGSRFSVAAVTAAGLRSELANGASPPVCQWSPTKESAYSPYLFRFVLESVTPQRAVVETEVSCDQGPMQGYWAHIRYVLVFRKGHWRLLPGRRAAVT
jgi:hypothetical protein